MENLSTLSVSELIELTKKRDSDALNELYRRHRPMVENAISRYRLRIYDRNDWHQDAIYICYESTLLFKPEMGVKFSGFFQLRFLNHAKSLVRSELALKRRPYAKAIPLDINMREDTIQEAMAKLEISPVSYDYVELEKCIDQLSVMELLAFKNHIGQISESECLEKLNCSKFQFIAAKHRCRRKIKKFL